MLPQRLLHLNVIAVVGIEEIGANEEQNHAGVAEMMVNLAFPFRAGLNLAVIPLGDTPRSSN